MLRRRICWCLCGALVLFICAPFPPPLFCSSLYKETKKQREKERKREREKERRTKEGRKRRALFGACSPLCCCLTSPEVKSRKKQTNQEAFFFLFSARLSVYLPLSFSISLLLSPALLLCFSRLTSNNRHRRGRKGRASCLISASRSLALSPSLPRPTSLSLLLCSPFTCLNSTPRRRHDSPPAPTNRSGTPRRRRRRADDQVSQQVERFSLFGDLLENGTLT